jgi:hypothetical protein
VGQGLDPFSSLTKLVLLLGWWYLIAAAVHEEVLPGDHQFWLTRPYSWKSLVAARALFILIFINLPKVVADCVILESLGFDTASYWPNLIASQVLFIALWLLPFAALAALTANLRQFILVVFLLWLGMFLVIEMRTLVFDWGSPFGGGWMPQLIVVAIVLLASFLILLWQYSQRRTAVASMMVIVTIVLVLGIPHLLPIRKLIALEMRLARPAAAASSIRIELDSNREEPTWRSSESGDPGTIQLDIPLQVIALAEGTELFASNVAVEIAGREGKVSRAKGRIVQHHDGYWERIHVDSDFLEQVKEEQVDLRTSAYFAVLGDPRTTYVEPGKKGTIVPGFGLCRFVQDRGGQFAMACYTPFRRPQLFARTLISDRDDAFDNLQPGSYSPFPAEVGIGPMVVAVRGNGSTSAKLRPRIITEVLLSHSRNEFEIRGIRLDDFRASRD